MASADFPSAQPLAQQWLRRMETESPGSGETARVRQVLGSIEDRLGNHAAAFDLLTAAAREFSQAGAPPEEQAACAEEASLAAHAAGLPDKSLEWQRGALAFRQQVRPPRPARTSLARTRMAELLLQAGRPAEAAAAALTARTEAAGDPAAECLSERCLGVQAHTMGRWEEAVTHFALSRERVSSLGADADAMRAALDGQTGQSLLRAGRIREAGPFLEEAHTWFSTHFPDSEESAAAANNLSEYWMAAHQPDRALEALDRALGSGPARVPGILSLTLRLQFAAVLHRLGNYAGAAAALSEARGLAEKHLPPIHPLRAQIATAAAALARDRGEPEQAAGEARTQARITLAWLNLALRRTNEAGDLDFRRTLDPVSPLAAFAPQDTVTLANTVLAAKGSVLRQALAALGAPEAALIVPDLTHVQASLPDHSVLVDFIRWRDCRPGGEWDTEGRYGALLITRGSAPRWVDLGPAPEIEQRLRRVIAAARDTVSLDTEPAGRASMAYQLSQLRELVWAPLERGTGHPQRLLLRPDGMLHFMPWAVLRDPDGSWFCDRWPDWEVIAQPAAAVPKTRTSRWRVLAVPDAPASGLPDNFQELPGWLDPELLAELRGMPPLPGALREAALIRSAAPPGWNVDFPAARKSEFILPGAPPPDVIHFAGHGFSRALPAWDGGAVLQAGLVMADFAEGLRRGPSQPFATDRPDGVLLTSEAARLPLSGTSLVVLSGCGTGLGEWQAGEHFTGLRHAFLTAGAGAVASTLWDLNDSLTPELIRLIYGRLAAGETAARAVAGAQRDWLHSPEALALPAGKRAALAGAWTVESAGWRP